LWHIPSMKHLIAPLVLAVLAASAGAYAQQSPSAQAKVAQIREAMALNKQALSHYTWEQQETVSVNGDVKKQMLYSVQIGANGQQVKTDISQSPSQSGRKFGIRHRITEDYENYAKSIGALAQSYVQADPAVLKQLYAQGNVAVRGAGPPGVVQLVIHNYVKSGDFVTIDFDRNAKRLLSLNISSYLSDPTDVVTIAAQFDKLPDGTGHVSTVTINGQSKNMQIVQQNLDYQAR